MGNPMISVIMGSYNSNYKINEAIKSIFEQTFDDWELIICDDCSNIPVEEIIKTEYLENKKVKIIKNKQNRGLAFSLNNCLSHAKGEYIARMDDDDYSFPTRFQKQVEFLDENQQYSFVSSDIITYDGINIVSESNQIEQPNKIDFLFRTPFVHPATMFRKSSLLSVDGYRVAKETRRAEDYDLFMRLYAENKIGYNIKTPLRYYVNPTVMKKKRRYEYRIDEMIVRYKGFKKMGILSIKNFIYVIKPLVVGLIPHKLLWIIKRR